MWTESERKLLFPVKNLTMPIMFLQFNNYSSRHYCFVVANLTPLQHHISLKIHAIWHNVDFVFFGGKSRRAPTTSYPAFIVCHLSISLKLNSSVHCIMDMLNKEK